MSDPAFLVRRLAFQDARQAASVASKAQEFVRLATAKLGQGGLGQGELCKGAACVELACMALGVAVDAALVARYSGVKEGVYRSSKAALQKVLGVGTRATARDLCIQYGCARHDAAVRACLAAFKERYVRSLPEVQRAHVDFGRAVFLAAAFYMVARKNKVQVDRTKLLGPLGVTATEFAQVTASMGDLCHDLVGLEPRKRRAEEVPEEHRALLDRTAAAAADDDGVASDSDGEASDPNMPGGRRLNPKKQRQREYDEWKAKVLAEKQAGKQAAAAGGGSSGAGAGAAAGKKKDGEKMTEKKLRQAVLSFAAGGGGGAGGPAAEQQQQEQRQEQQQQQAEAPKQAGGSSKAGKGGKKAALANKNA